MDKDDDKGEEDTTITVKRCQKGKKRNGTKNISVFIAKKTQSKIARHLERKHQKEDVAKATCLPKNSKKRRLLFDQLCYKGDYYHNVTVLETGEGEIVTFTQPSEEVNPHEYLPCTYCFAFLRRGELWKHEASCKKPNAPPQKDPSKRNSPSCSIFSHSKERKYKREIF